MAPSQLKCMATDVQALSIQTLLQWMKMVNTKAFQTGTHYLNSFGADVMEWMLVKLSVLQVL